MSGDTEDSKWLLKGKRPFSRTISGSPPIRSLAPPGHPFYQALNRILNKKEFDLPQEVQTEVFRFVLKILAKERLLKGKSIGIDTTTVLAAWSGEYYEAPAGACYRL